MTTVFDVFREDAFTYLTIKRGQVFGNQVVDTKELKGVIKVRSGFTRTGQNMELPGGKNISDHPTIHAHPEDFSDDNPIIGNGVRYNGLDYEIIGVTYGRNFDNGAVEHLTLTLREADYAA